MSALGQKRTLGHLRAMSALPPKADMDQHCRDVRFVPKADILRCSIERRYSITSSARPSTLCGIARPSALAVFRLTISSYLVGACTGTQMCSSGLFVAMCCGRPNLVGRRTEPGRSHARFYIGALCNSAIKLAAPKRGRSFYVCALIPATSVFCVSRTDTHSKAAGGIME